MHLRFDFPDAHGVVTPVLFSSPIKTLIAASLEDVIDVLRQADDARARGFYIAGYLSYEAAGAFDSALITKTPSSLPLAMFGVFERAVPAPPLSALSAKAPDVAWRPMNSSDTHRGGVEAIRAAIAEGETYQINYTFRLRSSIDPQKLGGLYAALARTERVPYGALLDLGDWQVLSLSPELFFRIDDGRVRSQPMKGTAPRGRWVAEDNARAEALAASEKNRAENVMIVDLVRNDMTRVCRLGSVRERDLFHVDRYASVLQMVSTVEGDLAEGATLVDIFRALFPAGSITGAPKASSMKLIAALEHAPRGVYCGAIGYASPNGDAVFNVAIRTVAVESATGTATYGVGGGITWDSDAADEHAEAMSKAACLIVREPFQLIETFRIEGGAPIRLERHLDRMSSSAKYFGWTFDRAAARALVMTEATKRDATTTANVAPRVRARLLLDDRGGVTIECRPLDEIRGTQRVAFAESSVDSSNRFLFHKTTARAMYDGHAASHPDTFDVLLFNERDQVTEFTRGNVVVQIDGVRVTPALECGVLAGVFREELLATGEVEERVLTRTDVERASRIWFVNSLREWIDVTLAP